MKVLVACEESQAVCKAFRELGHEAYSCDIQECSGGHPEWHVVGDCRYLITECCWICSRNPNIPDEMFGTFKTQDGKMHNLPARWDIIIAHPPCTYISNAGARWLFPNGKLNYERWQKGCEGAEFLAYFLNAPCDKIAVENPIPSKIFHIPPYTQVIQPYEYGHPYSKKTCLWLKGLPDLRPTEIVEPYKGRKITLKNGVTRYTCWEMDCGKPFGGESRAKARSKTFPGIAKAMAEQWGGDYHRENEQTTLF